MYGCIITVKSITYALKGEALLKKRGIECSVVKVDGSEHGCRYGIALSCRALTSAVTILSTGGVEIGKIIS
jgi:hypothetical protein